MCDFKLYAVVYRVFMEKVCNFAEYFTKRKKLKVSGK